VGRIKGKARKHTSGGGKKGKSPKEAADVVGESTEKTTPRKKRRGGTEA